MQALAGANAPVVFATGAVVGRDLAPVPTLATLPVSFFMVGMAASTLPAGMIAERYGRRPVFMLGKLAGFLSGMLACLAIATQGFALFCLSIFLAGVYAAVVMSYRFAAAECVEPAFRPRALATVLAGGVAAGIVGGVLVSATMDLVPGYMFVGTYLATAAIAVLSAALLARIELPNIRTVGTYQGRPMQQIARQPRFIAAVVCGIVSYLLMNYLMTSAPLAMRMHGHSQIDANQVVQWHVVAMYAPSFVAGHLMVRYGTSTITGLGLIITLVSALFALTGMSVVHFMVALIVLGIGWNFGFAGASSMILETHRPEESARVQSVNDFLVFGFVAVGSFLSGGILTTYGWQIVCLLALPPAIAALVMLFFFDRRERGARRQTQVIDPGP
ncbi:MFS transporter [Pelagibacterium montanilacus]|uniref:MFS transporter n=1 Tax=Pelagibacterium montanilacus TaxID=2185280 RepID=UPI001FEBE6DE|nr:MFS transporter [Pelagibacterium montanilacus]